MSAAKRPTRCTMSIYPRCNPTRSASIIWRGPLGTEARSRPHAVAKETAYPSLMCLCLPPWQRLLHQGPDGVDEDRGDAVREAPLLEPPFLQLPLCRDLPVVVDPVQHSVTQVVHGPVDHYCVGGLRHPAQPPHCRHKGSCWSSHSEPGSLAVRYLHDLRLPSPLQPLRGTVVHGRLSPRCRPDHDGP
eukprot:4388425-Pyramimonas_sp.AAC.2